MTTDDTDSPPGYYDDSGYASKGNGSPGSAKDKRPEDAVPESRYVYYRPFSLDGAIPSKRAFPGGSPFVGRIRATAIPPPHTVDSLKRALAQAEELPDLIEELGLFHTAESRTPRVVGARVPILTGDIGGTPETALALLFHEKLPKSRSSLEGIPPGPSPQYLYYRLYTRTGEDGSTRAFAPGEPALGRVDRALIAPPRDVSSIKRHIARVESKPIYAFADLFTDVSAEAPQTSANGAQASANDAQAADAFLPDTCGASANNPILVLQPERRAGLHNRPLLVVAGPPDLGHSKRRWTWVQSRWLFPSPGDILHTDGIEHMEQDKRGWHRSVYTAVDRTGRTGCESSPSEASHSLTRYFSRGNGR
ncbi:hypothetical protein B0H17DRAFT_1040924 [Mycena rosella]|uniref:Uncharacterized protein n=1 Tax=Mycena rosella TaxID=1033263 RepID=A0AAD7GRM6_MYCRO|nr:hypothetical protein B0H17DRAFT_1040924 [Mycena rosella]